MKDQYGNQVPDDLVVLDIMPQDMTEQELSLVTNAYWYEVPEQQGMILVSAEQTANISETNPLDAGIEVKEVNYIAQCLKRWNEVDGFYHA